LGKYALNGTLEQRIGSTGRSNRRDFCASKVGPTNHLNGWADRTVVDGSAKVFRYVIQCCTPVCCRFCLRSSDMLGGTRRQDGVLDVSNHNRQRFSLQGAPSAKVEASLWRFVIGQTARNRYGSFHSLRYSKVSLQRCCLLSFNSTEESWTSSQPDYFTLLFLQPGEDIHLRCKNSSWRLINSTRIR
jgi:hypothetical protein